MSVTRLVNRNVIARGGRTSMRLEPELWDALQEIGKREKKDVSTLVRQVEAAGYAGGRTSAIRVFITTYFRSAATEMGHAAFGPSSLRPRRTQERPELTLTEGPSRYA
jgi:predicted DNA-binding ribbon-helix-helix protein